MSPRKTYTMSMLKALAQSPLVQRPAELREMSELFPSAVTKRANKTFAGASTSADESSSPGVHVASVVLGPPRFNFISSQASVGGDSGQDSSPRKPRGASGVHGLTGPLLGSTGPVSGGQGSNQGSNAGGWRTVERGMEKNRRGRTRSSEGGDFDSPSGNSNHLNLNARQPSARINIASDGRRRKEENGKITDAIAQLTTELSTSFGSTGAGAGAGVETRRRKKDDQTLQNQSSQNYNHHVPLHPGNYDRDPADASRQPRRGRQPEWMDSALDPSAAHNKERDSPGMEGLDDIQRFKMRMRAQEQQQDSHQNENTTQYASPRSARGNANDGFDIKTVDDIFGIQPSDFLVDEQEASPGPFNGGDSPAIGGRFARFFNKEQQGGSTPQEEPQTQFDSPNESSHSTHQTHQQPPKTAEMSRTADLKAILLGGFGASALIGNAPRGKFMTEEEVIENIKGKQNTKRVEPTKEDHEGMSLVMAALGGISLSQPTSPVGQAPPNNARIAPANNTTNTNHNNRPPPSSVALTAVNMYPQVMQLPIPPSNMPPQYHHPMHESDPASIQLQALIQNSIMAKKAGMMPGGGPQQQQLQNQRSPIDGMRRDHMHPHQQQHSSPILNNNNGLSVHHMPMQRPPPGMPPPGHYPMPMGMHPGMGMPMGMSIVSDNLPPHFRPMPPHGLPPGVRPMYPPTGSLPPGLQMPFMMPGIMPPPLGMRNLSKDEMDRLMKGPNP